MKDYRAYFKDKKITVMRVGLIGRGIGDTAFMAEAGAEILVVDAASQEIMQPAVDALKEYPNVAFKFGPYENVDFEGRDLVLVGAGAPSDLPCLLHARACGVPLMQSAALFAELSEIPVIGVTGTRGKSTVTHMIHHVLSEVTGEHIILGGNVRGVSNLQLLKEVQDDSLAVMELDSWQLQGFGWAKKSPQIAVFTNLSEDHMNYYHNDMDAYFNDKAQIFLYQNEGDTLVTTPEIFKRATAYMKEKGSEFTQDVELVDASTIPEDCLLSMPGEHNRLNASLATAALKATGLSDEEIFAALATFPGVPGRLEFLGTKNGVRIYNDNNATTPTATVTGLRAVGEKTQKNVVLIMGGDDKGLDMSELIAEIPKWCSKVVLFKERGTDRVRDEIFALQNQGIQVYEEEGLLATVTRALQVAEPGETLLYSPAFSSFGKYFKNEYDRNDQFVSIIKSHETIE